MDVSSGVQVAEMKKAQTVNPGGLLLGPWGTTVSELSQSEVKNTVFKVDPKLMELLYFGLRLFSKEKHCPDKSFNSTESDRSFIHQMLLLISSECKKNSEKLTSKYEQKNESLREFFDKKQELILELKQKFVASRSDREKLAITFVSIKENHGLGLELQSRYDEITKLGERLDALNKEAREMESEYSREFYRSKSGFSRKSLDRKILMYLQERLGTSGSDVYDFESIMENYPDIFSEWDGCVELVSDFTKYLHSRFASYCNFDNGKDETVELPENGTEVIQGCDESTAPDGSIESSNCSGLYKDCQTKQSQTTPGAPLTS